MHAGTEIDEAFRPLDQRGQNVGRQCVDREDMRQTIGCDAMALPIADSGIADHGIEAAERVGLGSNILCAGDGLDISYQAFRIAGMEENLMIFWLASNSPAIRPRPVVEPEMKTRDRIFIFLHFSANHGPPALRLALV